MLEMERCFSQIMWQNMDIYLHLYAGKFSAYCLYITRKMCFTDNKKIDDETCVFGNKTIARKERIEDDVDCRVCVCEDGGHLKCQPRCPLNETTTTANQHDGCVTLKSPKYNLPY